MAIDITPSALLEFAKTIKGNAGSAGNARVATVTRIDKDGVVYVSLPGGVDETPLATSGALLGVGDTVYVTMSGGKLRAVNNYSEPSIGARSVDSHVRSITTAMQVDIDNAKTVADEAAAVAAATNQHFWDDDNGAHVTDVTHDEWLAAVDDSFSDLSDSKQYSNVLLNSLGMLLRSALNNLVSITRSAVAFYDGLGNAASNIVAQFGASGARIGKVGGNYAVVDEDSFDIYHGQEEITHIGYGSGNSQSGVNLTPYYTLGTRRTTVSEYNSSYTYAVGDHVIHNNAEYVCKTAITSGEAWNSSHWQLAIGNWSLAKNVNTTASGYASNAEGMDTTAMAYYSHAEGVNTLASGGGAHVEGYSSSGKIVSSGFGSHAEGLSQSDYTITASGNGAHAEGAAIYGNITASGDGSHAEGSRTQATGFASHAEGNATVANGNNSHAQNYGTIAGYNNQTAIGSYNENKSGNLLEIGNGISDSSRSNAFEVDSSGNVIAANDFKITKNGTDTSIFDLVYPVGSIYMSANSTSPATLFGGTWSRIAGKFLLAATPGGSSGAQQEAGNTGGEETVTLTAAQSGVPAHVHGLNSHTHGTGNTTNNGFLIGSNAGAHTVKSGTDTTYNYVHVNTGTAGRVTATGAASGNTASNTATDASLAHNNMPPYLSVNVWQRTA